MIYVSIGLLVIGSIILLILYKYNKNKILRIKEEEILQKNIHNLVEQLEKERLEYQNRMSQIHHDFDQRVIELTQERDFIERSLIERRQAIEEIIKELNNRKTALERIYEEQREIGMKQVEQQIAAHRSLRMQEVTNSVKEEESKRRQKMEEGLAAFQQAISEIQTQKQQELDEITALIEDFKKKRDVINEEILRRRQVEEQQDFYRVVLDNNAISDMQILLSIREKLISHENLDKLIYDGYIAKPANEMIKRVLNARAPSGIYKITRLKTGEIYIGKSTDIKKRWGEHCKTAYGVGTIAHSILHTTIRRDGIENFTFELLEEVPKDKLTEREKYWINFYDSKKYGMNEREG